MINRIKLSLLTNWLVTNCAIKRRNKVVNFLGAPSFSSKKLIINDETNKKRIKLELNSTSLIPFILEHTVHDKVWEYMSELNNPLGQQIVRQVIMIVTDLRGLQLRGNEIIIPMTDRLLSEITEIFSYSLIDAIKLALLPKNSNSPKFRESLANIMLKLATNDGTEKISDIFKRCLIGVRSKLKIDSKDTAFISVKRVKGGYDISMGTYLGEVPIRTYHIHPEFYPMILNIISISNKNVEVDHDWLKKLGVEE